LTQNIESEIKLKSFQYDVYLCSYNAENNIQAVIESILTQTIQPRMIKVFDDNSTDNTKGILALMEYYYDNIDVTYSFEIHGYDTSRLPKNINSMMSTKDGYIMILSDDVVLPKHYVESLAKHLVENKNVVIISGNETNFKSNSPRGSGRLIDVDFFNKSLFKGKFPENISWESALLFLAEFEGYNTFCNNDIHYRHLRGNGVKHGFNNYGQMMYDTGYSPFYVFGRIIKNFLTGYEFPRKKAFKILFDYINAKPSEIYSKELKSFIRTKQNKRLFQIIKTFITSRLSIIMYAGILLLALSGIHLR
jgi:glycosyltransferase involved in cell wall biosynthesis